MKIKTNIGLIGVGVTMAAAMPVQAADSLTEALKGGKVALNARLRYETSDNADTAGLKDAEALTLRTRLGYKTDKLGSFSAYGEFEDVRVVAGFDEFSPESSGFDTIGDAEITEVNQAYIKYEPSDVVSVKAGRQRIILDNARFVGNVGWRQDEQTYDGIRVDVKTGGFSSVVAYLDNVNGVGTEESTPENSGLVNLGYKFDNIGKLSAYYYDLEDNSGNDDTTAGLRFAGKTDISDSFGLVYIAEAASQEVDNVGSTKTLEADYSHLKLGVDLGPVVLAAGQEVLGSDDGNYGFQTRLATKHGFNGWADKFLTTPKTGLEDSYAELSAEASGVKFKLVYHEFADDHTGQDLGTELDLIATRKIAKNYSVGVKYAAFSAEDNNPLSLTDTDKFWLWGTLKF